MNNNGKNLLDKLSELDPELITNADKKPVKRSGMIIGFTSGMAAVAAATIIAVAANNVPERVPPIAATSEPVSSSSVAGTSDTNSSTESPAQSTVSDPTVSDPVSAPETAAPADPPQLDFSKYKDLPKISDTVYYVGGAGGGSLDGVSTSWGMQLRQLENTSPWNGEELETMPVYMSCSTDTPDLEKMYARVKEAAAVLGISEDELEITDTYYNEMGILDKHREWAEEEGLSEEEIEDMLNRMFRRTMSMVQVTGKADGVTIRLNTAYDVCIHFDKPVSLPYDYNFTTGATAEERAAAIGFLSDKYKELMGYVNPMPGEINTFSDGNYIYDADGELIEQIVNYWINSTEFIIERNKLYVIWLYSDDALEKIADYPVLTAEQALAILKSNKYNDDNRMPADAKILKTELYYSNVAGATAVMPYYRFYTESDNENSGDFEVVCDIYTIAAVPEEFIDMETDRYGAQA